MNKELVYLREAAAELHVAQDTLRKYAERGKIPAQKIMGRWLLPVAWVEQEKKTPQQSIGKTVGKRGAVDQQSQRQFFKEWRSQIQHKSLDQFIWTSHLEDLAKHVTLGLPESDNRAQPYRKAIAHHAKAIRPEKFQPSVEDDSRFGYIKELYPDDSVWQAQDSWDTAYAAYFNAFDTWSRVTEEYAESLAEALESEDTVCRPSAIMGHKRG